MDIFEAVCKRTEVKLYLLIDVSFRGKQMARASCWVEHDIKTFSVTTFFEPGADWQKTAEDTSNRMLACILSLIRPLAGWLPGYTYEISPGIHGWGVFPSYMWSTLVEALVKGASEQQFYLIMNSKIACDEYSHNPAMRPYIDEFKSSMMSILYQETCSVTYEPRFETVKIWDAAREVLAKDAEKRCHQRLKVYFEELMQVTCHPNRIWQL